MVKPTGGTDQHRRNTMDANTNNVVTKINGDKLVIEVDLSKNLGPSKTGKTTLVGSSRGYTSAGMPDGIQISLNVIKK
jgi:hypothetical protein